MGLSWILWCLEVHLAMWVYVALIHPSRHVLQTVSPRRTVRVSFVALSCCRWSWTFCGFHCCYMMVFIFCFILYMNIHQFQHGLSLFKLRIPHLKHFEHQYDIAREIFYTVELCFMHKIMKIFYIKLSSGYVTKGFLRRKKFLFGLGSYPKISRTMY